MKTIEARKGGSARQSAILAKLGILGGSLELDEEDEEDEVDWDMEESDDADMTFDEMSDGVEEMQIDEEEDGDLTDEEERGTETIQRLKNDLFEEENDEDEIDPGMHSTPHLGYSAEGT